MNRLLFLFFCFLAFTNHAQDQAYYLNSSIRVSKEADLLLFDLFDGSACVEKAFSFQDDIRPVAMNYFPRISLHDLEVFPEPSLGLDSTIEMRILFHEQFPSEKGQIDSLEVLGKWYTVLAKYSTDAYLGGRPSQDNYRIWVKDLGLIYSYDSYFNHHNLFMLCHSDTAKQRVLEAVYEYLDESSFYPNQFSTKWSKLAKLSSSYRFETCFKDLADLWKSSSDDLKLTSYNVENINGQIHFSATLKNVSSIAYALPEYFNIAPTHAKLKVWDGSKVIKVLDSSGRHYKTINSAIYLSPDDEINFSHIFPERSACHNCQEVTYSGFQIVGGPGLLEWLLRGIVTHEEKLYITYPHQEF